MRYFHVLKIDGVFDADFSDPKISMMVDNGTDMYIGTHDDIEVKDTWIEVSEEEFREFNESLNPPQPDPEPTPQEVRGQAILDTAVDMEYLLCLQELGLLVVTE